MIALGRLLQGGLRSRGPGILADAMSVAIELANETAEEAKTRDRLVRVLDTYPLERWQFTDRVRIEGGAISHSHPVLTLGTGYPSDLAVLSSYLHEQLHWFSASCAGNDAVLKQLRDRYPEPPIGYPDGACDEHASYVH